MALQYSCLEIHGHRSLAAYSPWSCKELDTTELTHTHTYTHTQDKVEFALFSGWDISLPLAHGLELTPVALLVLTPSGSDWILCHLFS